MAARSGRISEHPEVGAQLREAAEKLRLSEGDIAMRTGLSRAAVKDALTGGNATLSTLKSLLSVLEVERLKIGGTSFEASDLPVDPSLLRFAASQARTAEREAARAAAYLDRLVSDLERREDAVRLAGEITGRREPKRAPSSGRTPRGR